MTATPPLVLLTGAFEEPARWAGLVRELGKIGPVLNPDTAVSTARPVTLEDPALSVLAAVSGSGADAGVLCGLALGAMIALQVAATHPERVSALVLSTGHVTAVDAMRSIHDAVLGLVPAWTVQRLRGAPRQVLTLLDQVRPIDFRPLVEQVSAPVLVLCGERDVTNLGPSRVLARSLSDGELVTVPGAAAGWQADQPEVFARLVREFLRRRGVVPAGSG